MQRFRNFHTKRKEDKGIENMKRYGPLRYEDVHLLIMERMEEVVADTALSETDRLWFMGAMIDLDNRVWRIVEERLEL